MSDDFEVAIVEPRRPKRPGPWRKPGELSADVYPGLSVWDDRVTGSITLNDSRLPLWAFVWTAVRDGWDTVEDSWEPGATYGYGHDDFGSFLVDLLELRGEFGRLVCMLANAERIEREQEPTVIGDDGHGNPVAEMDPAWWERPDLCEPIVVQLRRCIDTLTGGADG